MDTTAGTPTQLQGGEGCEEHQDAMHVSYSRQILLICSTDNREEGAGGKC